MSKGCKHLGIWGTIAYVLVLVGALNWGLVGLGLILNKNLDLVMLTAGRISYGAEVVYLLVGISAVVVLLGANCKKCKVEMGGGSSAPMGGGSQM